MHTINDKLKRLKEDKNALIFAHSYQNPEIQDIADFVGDSFELTKYAQSSDAKIIVFCGVKFMAETASILCPDKKILLPNNSAGCPMADSLTKDKIYELKSRYPNIPIVCYINTTAEVKAESDICCTSSNAELIVNSIDSNDIIFIPDQNLADFVSRKTKKNIIKYPGFCPIHIIIKPDDIIQMKRRYPQAEVLVHPECLPEVIDIADKVLSTSGMCRYVSQSNKRIFIIGTEVGIIHRLKKENPSKEFYPANENAICPDMKKINIKDVINTLDLLEPEVKVPDNIREKAVLPILKMLECSSQAKGEK